MELFAAMKLSKNDVLQLHKTFQKVDFDHSGSVDIVEMLTLLDVERTKFTEHVFTVFDSDGSGKIDFKEFVLALWNYCTIGQSSLGSIKTILFCPPSTSDSFLFFSHSRYVHV